MLAFVHVYVYVHVFAPNPSWYPDLWGHLWDVVNVGQSELRLLRWVETPGAKPQPPKHSCDQQQDDQQPPEDKGLHWRDAACIHRQKDTGETTLHQNTYLVSDFHLRCEDLKAKALGSIWAKEGKKNKKKKHTKIMLFFIV